MSDAVDFDASWSILSASLQEIHTKNASQLSFEELYRNAYKLVLKKKGEFLYLKVKELEECWLSDEIKPQILAVLSSNLIAHYAGNTTLTTANERRIEGEKLLKALKWAWEDHNVCMNMITDVLMYMVCWAKSFCGNHITYRLFLFVSNVEVDGRIASTVVIIESLLYLPLQWVYFVILSLGPQYRITIISLLPPSSIR